MLRDKNLIPLSRQHQHALALCVRIDTALQADDADLDSWQAEIEQIVEEEISLHFAAEEKDVFPVAERFADLRALTASLRDEHQVLRTEFAKACQRAFDRDELGKFSKLLSQHIRKEERQLFEGMQQKMTAQELRALGEALHQVIGDASQVSLLPSEKAWLKANR